MTLVYRNPANTGPYQWYINPDDFRQDGGMSWDGPWNSGLLYPTGSVVSYGGSVYVATADNTGVTPGSSTVWQVFGSGGGGGVSEVKGTGGRITVADGTTVAKVDIDAAYPGQASIITLGTVSTGVWNGTPITVPYGGSGATTLTGYLKGTGATPFTASATIPAADISGVIGISQGGSGQTTANAALNAFLPSQGGNAGKVLSTDGTNTAWIAPGGTGTVTSVAVSSSDMTVGGSPIVADGTITLALNTVPATKGGTGQSTYATGDTLYSSAANVLSKLAIGTTGQIYAVSAGGIPEWLNALTATHGGTAQTSYAQGDMLYASAINVLAKLGIGTAGQVLTVGGGNVPVWQSPTVGGTVTDVSVVTANGVSGSVANATTTPAITLTLGAITPTSVISVAALTLGTSAGNANIILAPNGTGKIAFGTVGNGIEILQGTGASALTFQLTDARTSYLSAITPAIYATAGGGSGPFASAGGLVIQPRTTASRDLTFAVYDGASIIRAAAFTSAGNLLVGDTITSVNLTGGGGLAVQSSTAYGSEAGAIFTNGGISAIKGIFLGRTNATLGTIRMAGNTSGYCQIQPSAAAGSWTMTLPTGAGTSGYVLSTDGAGVTSWVAQSGGGGTVTSVGISSTDLSVSGSPVTASGTIALDVNTGAITLAKMANLATAQFIGRNTAGTGVPESLSMSTARTMLSINNVENTALSTWAGSTNLTTLGTITVGDWNGTPVAIGYGGTGSTTATDAFDALSPATTKGDLVSINLGTNVRIPVGTDGQVLSADSTAAGGLKWITAGGSGTVTSVGVSSSDMSVSGSPITTSGTISLTLNTVGVAKGGTGLTSLTTGDMYYASGTNTLATRGIGSSGQVLTVSGGVPSWQTPAAPVSAFSIVKKTATYAVSNSDCTIVCNFSSNGTVTLPVSSLTDGHFYTVVRTGGAGLVDVYDGNGNLLRSMNAAMESSTWVWCNADSAYYETAHINGS